MLFGGNAIAQQSFASVPGAYFFVSASETASGIDATAMGFLATVQEAATGTDQITSQFAVLANINESAIGIDQVDSTHFFGVFVDETASTFDDVSSSVFLSAAALEAASGQDVALTNVNFITRASETVRGQDAILSSANFLVVLSEGATVSDLFYCRFLWEQIDNDQAVVWVDAIPITTLTETALFADNSFGGVPFAGSATTILISSGAWMEINDDQNPNWTPIDAPS